MDRFNFGFTRVVHFNVFVVPDTKLDRKATGVYSKIYLLWILSRPSYVVSSSVCGEHCGKWKLDTGDAKDTKHMKG